MAQLVRNPFAMWETWIQSLGWKDPSILAWRIPWTIHLFAKRQTQLSDFHFTSLSRRTTMRSQSTPTRMVKIKNSDSTKQFLTLNSIKTNDPL